MARALAIGSVRLSDRAPRIVAAGGAAEVDALAAADGADLVELRADLWDDPRPQSLPALLDRVRAGGRPVILTVRAAAEGGRPMDEADRRALYLAGLPHADALDVEIASSALAAELAPRARAAAKPIMLSAHALDTTPPAAALFQLVDRGEALGADPTDRAVGPARGRRAGTAPPPPVLLVLERGRPARGLLLALRVLGCEQLLLRPPRAPALLAPDPCVLGRGRFDDAAHPRFELVEQLAPGEKTVEGLRALALALHDQAARPVAEHDAGRHLVDVLPALAARAHEVLVQVALAHAERLHARRERALLLGRHGEHARRLSIRPPTPPPRWGPRSRSAVRRGSSWRRAVPGR
jgi:hypothetical protein